MKLRKTVSKATLVSLAIASYMYGGVTTRPHFDQEGDGETPTHPRPSQQGIGLFSVPLDVYFVVS